MEAGFLRREGLRVRIQLYGDRFTHFPPAWEVPSVGETAALARLDVVDGAINAVEKDAFMIRLLDEGESLAIGAHLGVALDEFKHWEI